MKSKTSTTETYKTADRIFGLMTDPVSVCILDGPSLEGDNLKPFTSEKELAALAGPALLVEVYNGIPGVKQVKRFENRAIAASRTLAALLEWAQQCELPAGRRLDPERANRSPKPSGSPAKASKTAKAYPPGFTGHKGLTPVGEEAPTRQGSKTAQVIALMSRHGGATADELLALTGWQKHSLRGFVTGALRVKLGLTVISEKVEGRRVYTITAPRVY